MDATSAIIVFLFVITVFTSSGTSNKGNTLSPDLSPPPVSQAIEFGAIPGASFADAGLADPAPAIEKQVRKEGSKISPEEATKISACIIKYSQQYNINPKLFTGLIQ